MKEKIYYVYKITNLINGKIYIGKTSETIKKRFNGHKTAARKNKNSNSRIYNAINKYGEENFKIEVIQEYKTNEECLKGEIYYIALYNSTNDKIGYNITNGGEGMSGYKLSENHIKSIIERNSILFAGEGNPFYGKKHSDETRKIMSEKAIKRALKGENNPKSLLTEQNVLDIRKLYLIILEEQQGNAHASYVILSEKYKVSLSTIRFIISRKNWKHI